MKYFRLSLAALLVLFSFTVYGAPAFFEETADKVRFEQYATGELALFRLPAPGSSVFPGGTCTKLSLAQSVEIANRFIAFYLFTKSNNRKYFVIYETTTCKIISFGLDG